MITLPTSSNGTRTIMRSSIMTMSVTCCTSLVRRVTSLPVSSASRLPKESACTRRKSVPRRSAPKAWPARMAKTVQPMPPASPIKAAPTMKAPACRTTAISRRRMP